MQDRLHFLSKFLGIFLICLIAFNTNGQDFVTVNAFQTKSHDKQQYKALDEVLQDLETKFKVNFGFAGKFIENKMVSKEFLSQIANDDLNHSLKTLLDPLALRYEKLDDNNYVIYPREKAENQEG